MTSWWEKRSAGVEAISALLCSLDGDIQRALEQNPVEELVTAVARAANTDPTALRRVIASRRKPASFYHFIYHKPRGVLCQPNQRNREQASYVHDVLPIGFPKIPFGGRLDGETEGLLLFSDNGRLLNVMFAPQSSSSVLKKYYVKVRPNSGSAMPHSGWDMVEALKSMRQPLEVLGCVTSCAGVELCDPPSPEASVGFENDHDEEVATAWLLVTLHEGKNRQIRRLCKRAGLLVLRLIRVTLGPLNLDGLEAGEARALSPAEVQACYSLPSVESVLRSNGEVIPQTLPCPVIPTGMDLISCLSYNLSDPSP